MNDVVPVLMILAMLATLVVVVVGIVSFAVHGRFYKENSNKLMRMRVALQALALGLLALTAVISAAS